MIKQLKLSPNDPEYIWKFLQIKDFKTLVAVPEETNKKTVHSPHETFDQKHETQTNYDSRYLWTTFTKKKNKKITHIPFKSMT